MKTTYMGDTGARYDWKCESHEARYVVSYHHQNDCWTVQLLRDDGEREILSLTETEGVLREFLKQRVAGLTSRPNWTGSENRICDERPPAGNTSQRREKQSASSG